MIKKILKPARINIESNNADQFEAFCKTNHPAVAAEKISSLSPVDAWNKLKPLEPSLRAEIFTHLETDFQIQMIENLKRHDAALLFSDMPHDERADLFMLIPEDKQEVILPALAQAEREDIRRLTAYEEDTAGSVMTSDYAPLAPDLTASQAIEHLRKVAPDKETIYYAYVLDKQRKLMGFVSLKDLIIADRNASVSEIMHPEVIFAHVRDDKEDAARKIQKYDLLALPVVNDNEELVGIITYDDAIDIITQEHTEDLEKFMAISGSHEVSSYINSSAWTHFKNRAGWVVALALLGFVSGFVVQRFEGLLAQFAILATFMPMLADTGGNTGSQASTMVVRALALKEITVKDILKVLSKEGKVGLYLGLLLGIIAYARVIFFGGAYSMPAGISINMIGIAIAAALALQVVTATLMGSLLPIIASWMNQDPAVVSSPSLTTIVDITGLLIYFIMVKLVLGV